MKRFRGLVPAALAILLLPALPARPQEDEPLGAAASIGEPRPGAVVEVAAGSRLRRYPDPLAATELVLGEDLELPLLERRGAWARVRLGELKLWVQLEEPGPGTPAPPRPPAVGPDPRRLERARRVLGPAAVTGTLATCLLITDLDRPRLLRLFEAVASGVTDAYRQRYGIEVTSPRGAVVLFAEEELFRRYEAEETAVRTLGASGHAGGGVVAMFVGRRAPLEAAPVLIHELVHLLNRQVLGPRPPAWLEEGLASDLSLSRIDRRGRIDPQALGGISLVSEGPAVGAPAGRRLRRNLRLTGARAALNRLRQAHARTDPLDELVNLPWQEFVQPDRRELRYVHSGFFVRYLLEGDGGDLAAALRAHLAAHAAGHAEEPEALRRRLGRSWQELADGFARWLRGIHL